MAKDRGIACKSYVCEGNCKKKREGTFYKYCQKCSLYDPIPGGKNAKPNRKREKTEKFMKDKHFDNMPIILETPDETLWAEEIKFLRSLE